MRARGLQNTPVMALGPSTHRGSGVTSLGMSVIALGLMAQHAWACVARVHKGPEGLVPQPPKPSEV